MADPIPQGYHTVTPYLVVKGAAEAIEFYKKAFGAVEHYRMPGPDGQSVMHSELQIGDSIVMLCDENPAMCAQGPATLGGTPVSLFIYSENVDAAFARAVEAGATAAMPPTDVFWGDRYSKVTDPFGHEWSIATHIEDLTPEEIEKRGAQAMAQGG